MASCIHRTRSRPTPRCSETTSTSFTRERPEGMVIQPGVRPVRFTAAAVVSAGQLKFAGALILIMVVWTVLSPLAVAKVLVGLVLVFFAVFVGLFKMGAWWASTRYRHPAYS